MISAYFKYSVHVLINIRNHDRLKRLHLGIDVCFFIIEQPKKHCVLNFYDRTFYNSNTLTL